MCLDWFIDPALPAFGVWVGYIAPFTRPGEDRSLTIFNTEDRTREDCSSIFKKKIEANKKAADHPRRRQ